VRVRYRKVGPARFIGTRELGTVFLRAVRRAALPIAFSQGHHPLPRIAFGPALPVGTSSDDERVDLELTARRDPSDVRAALVRELPDGLEPLDAWEIDRATASIDRSTTAHIYDVDVTPLDAPPSADAVAAAVARFHASEVVPIRKHTKHGERTVDGRRMVNRLEQSGPHQLTVELAAGPDGTLKPGVLVATLLALPDDVVPLLRIHKRATRLADGADEAAGALA
jgi:radical SAM-linked protein